MEAFQQYLLHLQQNQPEQALRQLKQHLAANPRDSHGYFLAGQLLRDLQQIPEALCAYLEACRLDPAQADYAINLGATYQDLQQPEQAIQAFTAAYEKNPDPSIRYNRAMALLQSGDYRQGWQEFEWRIHSSRSKARYQWHPPERLWRGQPFPGEILVVYAEQGWGDTLQFCRYLPYVKALGGTVIFSAWKELLPVLTTLNGVDQLVGHLPGGPSEPLSFSWAVPLMSLPYLCRTTTLHSIPNETPYLSVPTAYRAKWQALLKPYLTRPGVKNVGFVFATNDTRRTIPLPLWDSLFALPGLQWFSLQKGEAAAAVTTYAANRPQIVDLSGHIENFADTAALLDELDLLISTDTATPHLAGALDKPVWLLLPFVIDYRWLLRRSDSPWYPSFRLFRQTGSGQWRPVLDQVRHSLLMQLKKG